MPRQRHDVFRPLGERRQSDRIDVDAIVQILAEGARRLDSELEDEPIVRAELYDTVARIQSSLGLLDDAMKERILEARRAFADNLPPELAGSVAFFSVDAYNAAASVQDNVLFGKIAYGEADAAARVGRVMSDAFSTPAWVASRVRGPRGMVLVAVASNSG